MNAPASLSYGSTNTLTTSGGSGTGAVSYSAGVSTGCSVSGSTLSVTNASGTCAVRATKDGDTNYYPRTSAVVSVTLLKANQPTLTVNAPASLTYGSTSTLTISGGGGTGAVTYSAGASTGCTVTGSTLSVTNASGTCSVSASKAGDANFNAASSAAASFSLVKATPAISVPSIIPSPSITGQTYTVNFTVSHAAGVPSGDVTVDDGSGVPAGECSSILSSGSGSCSIVSTADGFDTLTVSYGGDTQFAETSSTFAHTVQKANTSLVIVSVSTNPTLAGEPYTVGVTVNAAAPGAGTPTGSVTVNDGEGNTCPIVLAAGSGSCELRTYSIGPKTLTANYTGDNNFNISENTTAHTVIIANSTITITSDNPDPSALDESVTLIANVAPVAPASGHPGGTVRFYEGAALLCSGALSEGEASCDYASLILGNHTITAVYVGDPTAYNGSTSAGEPHNVQQISLDDNATSTSFTDIGHFSTAGLEDTFTYTLQSTGRICGAANGAGNGYFEITGNLLQRKASTPAGNYSICTQSEDSAGGLVQAVFSIIINNPPSMTDLTLSRKTVCVLQSDVGTLATTDGWDPQVFSLETEGIACTAENSTGNAFFEIDGTTLKRKSETPVGDYAVCIQVKDANDETAQKNFSIAITNEPVGIQSSSKTVSTSQTVVGALTQQEGQGPFTYTLASSGETCTGANGADNALFGIAGANLQRQPGTPPGTYRICAQVEDANGMVTQKDFTITVTNPPSGLNLSNSQVLTTQTVVGTLTTVDGQFIYTYSLQSSGAVCNGANGADNGQFEVYGNALKRKSGTGAGFYTVCLQTADANGELFQKSFSILVAHQEPPVLEWNIKLTSDRLIDGDTPGTLAGTVVSSIKGTVFSLADAGQFPDSTHFSLTPEGVLTVNSSVDYSLNRYYSIRILAVEPQGDRKYLDAVITVMKNSEGSGMLVVSDDAILMANQTVTIDILTNDLWSTGATGWDFHQVVQYPSHGDAQIGSVVYTPHPNWYGSDFLSYRACDNLGFCAVARVNLTVNPLPSPATGFAPGVTTILPIQGRESAYTSFDGEILISIPRISANAPIVGVPTNERGWDITWLGNDVGWLKGSAAPTWNGNAVLTGHLYDAAGQPGVFYGLNQLMWGDHVIISMAGSQYVFEVREVQGNVSPDDMDTMFAHKDQPWLTLITCQGFDAESGTYDWRYIVRAVLVRTR